MTTTRTAYLLSYGPDGEPDIVRARFADRINGSHHWSERDLGHGIDPLTNPPTRLTSCHYHPCRCHNYSASFRPFSQQKNLSFISHALHFAHK